MTQSGFDFLSAIPRRVVRSAWTTHPGLHFRDVEHVSGWWIEHCGHPTALWPYTVTLYVDSEAMASGPGKFRRIEEAKQWLRERHGLADTYEIEEYDD